MLKLRLCPTLISSLFCCLVASASVRADLLWYSGNPTSNFLWGNTLTTEANPDPFFSAAEIAFEDFTVDSPTGWNIGAIFSNNLLLEQGLQVNMATWSIRTGVSASSLGTIIAEGTSPVTVEFNGIDWIESSIPGWVYRGAKTTVSSLNLHLDPGAYWIQVTPLLATGRTFLPTPFGGILAENSLLPSTDGAGAIGAPVSNNNIVVRDLFRPNNFVLNANGSFGIQSSVSVPEPGTVAMLIGFGASGFGLYLRRRKR